MSGLLALGLSHHTAPLALRERAAMTEGRAAGAMREMTGAAAVDEAVVVSTCNRTEIYLAAAEAVAAESLALGALAAKAEMRPTELASRLYVKRGPEAARHLFRVASGLDSVVVGEAEIQGQVRRAYDLALVEGATGPILNRLFQAALATGGRVRSETGVGVGGVSLSSVAVEMAEREMGDLDGLRVMLIGAGETARLVANALANRGASMAFIANRHHERAEDLAAEHGGEALTLEQMRLRLGDADLIISATNSPHHVLDPAHFEGAGESRGEADRPAAAERRPAPGGRARRLILIDLAVPRDIHPGCGELDDISLFDIDDLQSMIERNARNRARDAEDAEAVVSQEAERFQRWWETLRVLPTVAALNQRADAVVSQVLAENDGAWSATSDADRERLAAMAAAVAKRLLDEPIRRLKTSDESLADGYAATLRELFDLER